MVELKNKILQYLKNARPNCTFKVSFCFMAEGINETDFYNMYESFSVPEPYGEEMFNRVVARYISSDSEIEFL